MSSCQINGTPDMYGLGIRIGFYMLWYGNITANWIARADVPSLRLITPLFISATFISLVVETSWATLQAVEVYIVVLLVYGTFYCWVPLYLWRLFTGCSPFWDPSQWPFVKHGTISHAANFVLLLAITSFQIWFWCTGVNSLPNNNEQGCQTWGFFLAQVQLNSAVFIAVNLLFAFVLLICGVANLLLTLRVVRPPRWLRKQQKRASKHSISKERQVNLQALQGGSDIIVISVVVVAVELTIQWNGITGVNDLSTAAQLIPFFVGAGLFAHLFYVFFFTSGDDDNSSSSSSRSSSGSGTAEVVDV